MSTSIPLEWISFARTDNNPVELQLGSTFHPATATMAQEAVIGTWTLLPSREELKRLSMWDSHSRDIEEEYPAHCSFNLVKLADNIELFVHPPGGECYLVEEACLQVTLYAKPIEIAKWAHFTILYAYLTRKQLKSLNPTIDWRPFRLFCLRWGLADVIGVNTEDDDLPIMTAVSHSQQSTPGCDGEDGLTPTESAVRAHVHYPPTTTSKGSEESDEEDYGQWLVRGTEDSDDEDLELKFAQLRLVLAENLPPTPTFGDFDEDEVASGLAESLHIARL